LPCCVFFFQAEDGIRDFHVTGVQTCALPIFSELARQERLLVVNGIELEAPKTKLLVQKLAALGVGENVLVLIEAYDEKLPLASRNLPYVDVLPASALNPDGLARHDIVLATVGAVRLLEERLA